jgi:hypothetical protein
LSLFSSELFGLEFYFKNGMLNPAVALPLALATLVCSRRAQCEPGARALRWVSLGAVAFAAVVFTHLLTAYMLSLALACFTFASGPRRFGHGALQAATMVGLGLGLAAFWLVPSLGFAAKEDAAYTWLRRPVETLSTFLDGSAFSSYFAGFYPRFFTFSAVGIVATVCAGLGLLRLARRPNAAVMACAATAILALLVAMGPRPSFGLEILPAYDRLLWYRFMTLAQVMTLLVSGWAAWWLWEIRERLGRAFLFVVAGATFWALLVLTQRANAILTAGDEPGFVADVDAVASWLRAHGKREGRVYGEFLGQNAADSVSVNYLRHMIPILSGLGEASGWIYENNEAAQGFMRRGLLWYNPFPMIALAERYDVEYVAAGTPNLVHALLTDPRWRPVLETSHVSLFEAVGRDPSLVEAAGWAARMVHEGYLRGGGYEYAIEVAPEGQGERARSLRVKTSWSPAWRAYAGDRELPVTRSEDALVDVALPESPSAIRLTWDIGAARTKGNRISLLSAACVALLLGIGTRRHRALEMPGALIPIAGTGIAAIALAWLVAHARSVDPRLVGFGIRGGMLVTFDSRRAEVGAFDDTAPIRLTRVLESAWGPRGLLGGVPARSLVGHGAPAGMVTFSEFGPNRVTVHGVLRGGPDGDRADAPITLLLGVPGRSDARCPVPGNLGTAVAVPRTCLESTGGAGPGIQRTLGFEADGDLVVTTIDVDDGVVVVEAETMHNSMEDSGYEAFYALGPADELASNGVAMRPQAAGLDITLDRDVELPAARYDVWILARATSPHLGRQLARLELQSDDATFAEVFPKSVSLSSWASDPKLEWLPAGHVEGGGTRRIGVTFRKAPGASEGLGDLDALAFVPTTG